MKVLIILSSLLHVALCFCGDHTLHANMAESAIRVSNWLREHYHDDVTRLEPHVASAMIASLRLAGHLPHTIMSDFKTNDSQTVVEYLKSHLDTHQHKTLSEIKPGRIANIFQAILALCFDPQNFHGCNLTKALIEGFDNGKSFFEYSSVALAICQSFSTKMRPDIASKVIAKLDRGGMTQCRTKWPDGKAVALMALSCLRDHIPEDEIMLLQHVNSETSRYLKDVLNALRKHQDRSWNAQSKGLVVQAFMSLPKALRPRHWHCKRLMSAILEKYDLKKAFGNVLANIQILPALVGRSLVDLNSRCDVDNSQVKANKSIKVCIKLAFQNDALQQSAPDNLSLVVPEKTTAYEILKLAAEQNDAYKFEALETSYGRMITAISNIKQDQGNGLYWALYANETSLAADGVDIFTPKNNTCVIFKYEKCGSSEDTTTR